MYTPRAKLLPAAPNIACKASVECWWGSENKSEKIRQREESRRTGQV